MNEQLEEKIIAFFEGELSEKEKKELSEKRENSAEAEQLFQAYTLLYQDIENQNIEVPSKNITTNFEKLLTTEKQKLKQLESTVVPQKGKVRSLFLYGSVAAVLIALVVSMSIIFSNQNTINQMSAEMVLLRKEMKSLLNNTSTSVRIQAVNLSAELQKPDKEVVNVLVKTMNTDPSENVRLAAVNALGKFAQDDSVKKELITALENQESSYVQIKLINILSTIKAKEAIPTLDELIKNKNTGVLVKSEAEFGKSKIIEM